MSSDFFNTIIRLLESKEKESLAQSTLHTQDRRAEDRETLSAALVQIDPEQVEPVRGQ